MVVNFKIYKEKHPFMKIRHIVYCLVTFIFISIFTHKKEIFNENIVYGDNFYHYILYTSLKEKFFEKDLINTALSQSIIKKIIFNPLISKVYSYLLDIFETPKPISLIIAVISQILSSTIFFNLIIKTFPESSIKKAFIFSILFSLYISTTDFFFPDLRRNIGFVLFIFTIYNFYIKNERLFFISIFLYLIFYSVYAPFIFIFILIYFYYYNKIDKKYIFVIIIIIILSLTLLKSSDFFKDEIYRISVGFEWKDSLNIYTKDMNFFEKYIFNFDEHPSIHKYFFYSITFCLIIFLIIITKERKNFLKDIVKAEEIIIFISSLLSFTISAFTISYAFASKQMMFAVQFLSIFIFIKTLNILTIINFNKTAYSISFLFIISLLIFIPKIDQFEKVNTSLMNYIKNNTEKNSVILAHPSELFIPYYTKRTMYVMEDSEKIICALNYQYCNELNRRYQLATDIYYSDSLQEIKEKIKNEDIDLILVDKKYYSKNYLFEQRSYHRIRNLSLIKYTKNKNRKFELLEYAIAQGIKITEDIYIIDKKKFYEKN